MKYLSLFSGIGGFELGITRAHERLHDSRYETAHRQEAAETVPGVVSESERDDVQGAVSCIGFSEIDKYAVQTYQKHFPTHTNHGDITKINVQELPDFDLLVGGFPCQAFSIAGKRKGFDDTRGTLFFDIARILRAKQPRLLVLENVKGLLSHGDGDTFKTIITTLDELGYDLQWQVLNAKNFGVPQNRERVFIVGHLRGTPRPEVFPVTRADTQTTGSIEVEGYLSSEKWDKFNESSRRVYNPKGISPTIPTVAGGGQMPKIDVRDIEEILSHSGLEITEKGYGVLDRMNKIKPLRIPEATKKGYAEAYPGQTINLSVPNSKTRRGRVSDIANTLDTGMQQHTLTSDMRIRRLTPTECERLMGFPAGWTEGVSDSQRYKQCGNAVVVNVVEEIIKKLI